MKLIDGLREQKKDLIAAKNSLNSKDYDWSCFQSQQAVEKALKALQLKKTGKYSKTHDLIKLGRDVQLTQNLLDGVK